MAKRRPIQCASEYVAAFKLPPPLVPSLQLRQLSVNALSETPKKTELDFELATSVEGGIMLMLEILPRFVRRIFGNSSKRSMKVIKLVRKPPLLNVEIQSW